MDPPSTSYLTKTPPAPHPTPNPPPFKRHIPIKHRHSRPRHERKVHPPHHARAQDDREPENSLDQAVDVVDYERRWKSSRLALFPLFRFLGGKGEVLGGGRTEVEDETEADCAVDCLRRRFFGLLEFFCGGWGRGCG